MVTWRVLGPVRYWDGRRWQPVPARKERQLLAILLLRAGQAVERGWLIDALWGDPVPQSAARLLNHYVWRLRRLPAMPPGALRTIPSGYQLDVASGDLDSNRFNALLRQARLDARSGDHTQATELLTAALALWHGDDRPPAGDQHPAATALPPADAKTSDHHCLPAGEQHAAGMALSQDDDGRDRSTVGEQHAVALGQGEALVDCRDLGFIEQEAGRLEAQRVEAFELLAESLEPVSGTTRRRLCWSS